jgi:acyl carrier protein
MNNSVPVLEIVTAEICDLLDVARPDVSPESRLIDLGAQSFDFVELVLRLEKAFDRPLPKELMIPDAHTVSRYVEAILASSGRH